MTHVTTNVRELQPLVFHLTNQVVMNFSANGLLAFGGSPIMAKEIKEVSDIAAISNSVLINIGTATEHEIEAMITAGKAANEKGIPVVLDPVGVAASPFRQESIRRLLEDIQFTAIKGNAGEMAHLVEVPWQTKGVESIDDDNNKTADIAGLVASKYDTIAVVTGEVDVICQGNQIKENETGHTMLTKITGAGCLLGSILAACLATNRDSFDAIYEGIQFYGKAAQNAANRSDGNGTGTFIPHFIDALSKKED